jgi:hypothetical protein
MDLYELLELGRKIHAMFSNVRDNLCPFISIACFVAVQNVLLRGFTCHTHIKDIPN